jgi:hypothetical protein
VILAGIGCGLAMSIISVTSILQIRTVLPERFIETTSFVSLSVWMFTNVVVGLVWGGILGIASGFTNALADTLWTSGQSIARRYLLASLAGLIYSFFLISTAMSSGNWTDQEPGVFIPVYIAYGLVMGASFSLVVPPLGERSGLRRQITRSFRASLIIAVAGALSLFLAYGGNIEGTVFRLDLFIFIAVALIFPLGLAIMLSRKPI